MPGIYGAPEFYPASGNTMLFIAPRSTIYYVGEDSSYKAGWIHLILTKREGAFLHINDAIQIGFVTFCGSFFSFFLSDLTDHQPRPTDYESLIYAYCTLHIANG